MTLNGWLQIALMLVLVVATARPLGVFMASVLEGRRTFLHPVLRPVERGFYALAGVDETREQSWLGYTLALLVFNAAGFVLLYAILRLQDVLPLNPQGFGADERAPRVQHGGVASSPTPTGRATAARRRCPTSARWSGSPCRTSSPRRPASPSSCALARAFARAKATTVGNFWVDLTRVTLYVLLPLSIVRRVRAHRARHAAEPQPLRRCDDARRRQADDRAGPGRQPGRHQAARHQRRRLLQRQLRAPVREPEHLDQHHRRSGRSSRSRLASPSPSAA